MHRSPLLSILAACASLAAGNSPSAQLTGVTWSGDTVAIYPDGQGNVVGATGFTSLNSMARLPDGTLISATKADGSAPRLVALNPLTGGATFFVFPFLNDIRALAVSPLGWLYALNANGPACDLYLLDLGAPPGSSAIKILVGTTSIIGVQGMTFGPDGVLYGWSVSAGLIMIDEFSALCTDVNPDVGGTSAIQSLAFGPDGTLYGAGDELHRIDLATGEPARIGGGGYAEVRGIEWDADSFPALTATPLLAPGDPLDVVLSTHPGGGFAVGLSLVGGPTCVPSLPFCLELGSPAQIAIVSQGPVPPTGAVALSAVTPADPALLALTLHWQALTFDPLLCPRMSPSITSTFQ